MSTLDRNGSQQRLLKFLETVGDANVSPFNDGSKGRIVATSVRNRKKAQIVSEDMVDHLKKAELIEINGRVIKLTQVGLCHLSRAQASSIQCPQDKFLAQHRTTIEQEIRHNGGRQQVTINHAESPLMRLKSRNTSSGSPWISDIQFVAGERLRADFARAQLLPNITSNWDFSTRSFGKGGGGFRDELSDSALDARKRVETSMEYVGSDLAGLLIDVCCFLKGLEVVERERQWPARSAKLMLRTGLELLARRYGLNSTNLRSSK